MQLTFALSSLAGLVAVSAFAIANDASKSSTCSATTTALEQGKDIVDTAVAAGSFKTLATALKAAEMVEALKGKGPFTVFAPTDEAFAKIPREALADLLKPESKSTLQTILGFHVVPGRVMAKDVVGLSFASSLVGQRLAVKVTEGEVRIQGAKVVRTDIECSNGVIHVIDAVIMPNTEDVVATAQRAGTFKTLGAALQAAGLVEALRGEGPFTVFAPTDEAFAKLPKGTIEELLKPASAERLTKILQFHVISGRVYSDAAAKGAEVKTLSGKTLTTSSRDGSVYVGAAKVVKADIDAKNGVIHVIDTVLLP